MIQIQKLSGRGSWLILEMFFLENTSVIIIITALSKYALDVQYLRGQSYDGAGNMTGKYEGVAAQIQRGYPKAAYFHCAAHALNLCIVAVCSVHAIRNMHGTMLSFCLTFHLSNKLSLKRTSKKKEIVEGKSLSISTKLTG